ncbi:MAG: TrbC/VirB2 family protein [Candidatus Marsarchaeota archaeon]|nr:TrbC/VirB2 family protein [Candidatus Marsarchaeota archaeon]
MKRLLVLLLVVSSVGADAMASDISSQICNVVNLVKYIAGAVALLVLVILGVELMVSGSNPIQRTELKNRILMVVAGMFLILISNYIVGIFLPSAAACPLI